VKRELILGADIGTSSVKVQVFNEALDVLAESKHSHIYQATGNQVEMDGEMLFSSFLQALRPLGAYLSDVVALGFSVLCPGLFCMTQSGALLRPGIIHLDRRSEKQGLELAAKVGEDQFFKITGNLPYPGGVSVTSIQWIRENEPDVFRKTYKFGHTNTLFLKKLTGVWGIDPTNASFTGLYDTVGFTDWSFDLCRIIGIPVKKLPPVIPSAAVTGYLTREAAKWTGLRQGIPVIMGAADTACATFGAGAVEDGQLMNSTGTVEVMVLCTERPYYDRKFLLRTHVIPNRWMVMNIIGAGGESLNWAHKVFFSDLTSQQFFEEKLPAILVESGEAGITFTPHLAGDRMSIKNKTGILTGLTLATTREDILFGIVRGLIKQLEEGMATYRKISRLSDIIYYTGGGSIVLKRYKEKMFSGFKFEMVDNCALKGVGKLIHMALQV
jgi:xylulokinase